MNDEVTGNRNLFEATESEDSLLSHTELAARAVSFILRDFDLMKVDALSIEEAMALLLQETAFIRLSVFFNFFLYCFSSVS